MKFAKNIKIGLIIALCIIVVGMVFFGVFGLNKSVDYNINYRVVVSVDQDIDGEGAIAKETAESYFKEVGAKYFSVQEANEGADYIYTFKDNKIDVKVLENKIQDAVGDVVVASCSLSEVKEGSSNQVLNVVLALAVVSVVILAYLLIAEKAAVAFTVIINAIFASVLALALLALTRIPVFGMVEVCIAAAFILSAVISIVIASRMREISSVVGNEKMTYTEIAEQAIKDSAFRFIALAVLVVLASIVLAVSFVPQLLIFAGYVVIAAISAVLVAVIGTMLFWPVFKNVKK